MCGRIIRAVRALEMADSAPINDMSSLPQALRLKDVTHERDDGWSGMTGMR